MIIEKTDPNFYEINQLPETFQKLVKEVNEEIINMIKILIKKPKFEKFNNSKFINEIQKTFKDEWMGKTIIKNSNKNPSRIIIHGAKQHWDFYDDIKTVEPNQIHQVYFDLLKLVEKSLKDKINKITKTWGLQFKLAGDWLDQIYQFEFHLTSGVSDFLHNHFHNKKFITENQIINDNFKYIETYINSKGDDMNNFYLKEDEFDDWEQFISEDTDVDIDPPELPDELDEPEPEKEEKPKQDKSLTQQRHAEEEDKNGVRRKKLYIAFIEWAKEFDSKNTFGSLFQKDTFRVTYPFIPEEMRYFYRLANPLQCVLSGNLTFFSVERIREVNRRNAQFTTELMIFAATLEDVRVFNRKDKKIYQGKEEESGRVTLLQVLSIDFDNYLQKMIGHGDILNAPLEETKVESVQEYNERTRNDAELYQEGKKINTDNERSLTPAERVIVQQRFGDVDCSFKYKEGEGYRAHTHRASTEYYETLYKLPIEKVNFVSSTS